MEEVSLADVVRRIRLLLARRGLSEGDLGARVDDASRSVADIFAERREPTSLELALIAEVLGTSVPALVGPGARPALSTVAARLVRVTDAVDQALARLVELADLAQLLDTVGAPSPAYLLDPLPSTGPAYAQGAVSARAVRAKLGYEPDELLPDDLGTLMSWIEEQLAIDIAVEPLPHGIDGLSATQGTSRFILMNSRVASTRLRWTLAHELGHLENGDCESIVVDESVLGGNDEVETRANGFAAEFLAPGPLLARMATGRPLDERLVGTLLEHLGISLDALANRLHNSGVVNAADRDRIKSMAGPGELVRRVSRLPGLDRKNDHRIPKRLMRSLLDAYFERQIGIQPLATLLRVSADDLLREFGNDDGYDQEGVQESA